MKDIASKWKSKITPEQAFQISRASLVAEGIANAGSTSFFTIDIVKTKGLNTPLYHYLQLYLKKSEDKDYSMIFQSLKSSDWVTEYLWDTKDLKINWIIGTQLKILLWRDGYAYDSNVAAQSIQNSYAILDLAGSLNLELINGFNFGNPQVVFKLKLDGQPISETDREAFYTYFVRNTW